VIACVLVALIKPEAFALTGKWVYCLRVTNIYKSITIWATTSNHLIPRRQSSGQVRRLPTFIQARKQNWEVFPRCLAVYENVLEFALPTHATAWDIEQVFSCDETSCRTDCSWFVFKIAVKADAPLCRADLAEELDRNKFGNRMLSGW